MRFLRVFVGALLLLVLILFAVANRQVVGVSLEPLPFALDLPLYLLVFAVFLLGLVIGALADRLNAWGSARRRARFNAQQAAAIQAAEAVPAGKDPGGPLPPAPIA